MMLTMSNSLTHRHISAEDLRATRTILIIRIRTSISTSAIDNMSMRPQHQLQRQPIHMPQSTSQSSLNIMV